jgi:UDP-N-acetylglucosamine pyrophosphorylase
LLAIPSRNGFVFAIIHSVYLVGIGKRRGSVSDFGYFFLETCTYGACNFYSDWEKVSAPTEKQIVAYEQLPQNGDASSLKKLAILKVNGGLGTTMGEH